MSVDMSDLPFASIEDRVRDALIAAGKLTPDDVERIHVLMGTNGANFGDAARDLGLVTHAELAEFIEYANRTDDRSSDSIVQNALIKQQSGNRQLPVKYTKMVKAGNSVILANHPDSILAEQMRALRAELHLIPRPAVGGNILGILSPCAGEGRTQLSAELAIAFAQTGCRTLLIDGDLRRPRVHTLFPSDNLYGLTQALSIGSATQVLGVENIPHLSIMPSGPTHANPSALLTSGSLERLAKEWRRKYQMIIIDTPPISEYADGLTIASYADQILMVSRANVTPHGSIKELLRRLAGNQSRIVGGVINKF